MSRLLAFLFYVYNLFICHYYDSLITDVLYVLIFGIESSHTKFSFLKFLGHSHLLFPDDFRNDFQTSEEKSVEIYIRIIWNIKITLQRITFLKQLLFWSSLPVLNPKSSYSNSGNVLKSISLNWNFPGNISMSCL